MEDAREGNSPTWPAPRGAISSVCIGTNYRGLGQWYAQDRTRPILEWFEYLNIVKPTLPQYGARWHNPADADEVATMEVR